MIYGNIIDHWHNPIIGKNNHYYHSVFLVLFSILISTRYSDMASLTVLSVRRFKSIILARISLKSDGIKLLFSFIDGAKGAIGRTFCYTFNLLK
jgi:hypothetical protein